METNELLFAYDMATMALKGKRFREAEAKFKDLAMKTNSVEAWCGFGLSKYGLILEDVTVAEVFYCFDKARAASNDEGVTDVEVVIQEASSEVANQLYDLYVSTVLATRSAQHRKAVAMVSTVVGGISTLSATSKNRTMGSIASAGFAALSYDTYLKSHTTTAELKQLQDHITKIIEDLKNHVKVSLSKDKYDSFASMLEKKEAYTIDALKTDDQKVLEKVKSQKEQTIQQRNWWETATAADNNKDIHGNTVPWYNQQSKLFLSILIWPIWLYGMYKTDLISKSSKNRWAIVIVLIFLLGLILQNMSEH